MLIETYDLEVFTPPCEPGAERFSAIVRLTADIRAVLPYLNATLRGAIYEPAVPALRWTKGGHYVTFQPYQIAVSNVEDRDAVVSCCHRAAARRMSSQSIEEVIATWPTYGYRRVTAQIRRDKQWIVNGKRVRRLVQEMGLQVKVRSKRRRTTDSQHDYFAL